MLAVSDALATILRCAQPLRPEITALTSAALGQVLGTAISSDVDAPPYAKALMDGYAVRAADALTSPVSLRVIEEIAAGHLPTQPINPGETSRIFTGAALPTGADAVIPQEWTEAPIAGEVRLLRNVTAGQYVLEQGREMRRGDVVLEAGTVLRPQVFGVLASVGKTALMAYPRPRVAILATGDELVEPMKVPKPGKIRNSNGTMLLGQVVRAGGLPLYLGIARDNAVFLRSLIGEGLEGADVLVLSGGVSVGKFDLVPEVLKEKGVTTQFHQVALRPGKPLLFGTRDNKLVFGLPGNPVAVFVCFELFVRPALRKLAGHTQPGPHWVNVPLAEALTTENDRPTYWPAQVITGDKGFVLTPLPWFGSADLRSLLQADALIEIPAGKVDYPSGTMVRVLLVNQD